MTPIFDTTPPYVGHFGPTPAARANRRRRWVFAVTLLLACAASLYWVYSRPAEYQTSARWQFVFAEREDQASPERRPAEADAAFLTELQVITSRPLLEQLEAELQRRRLPLPVTEVREDAVDALRRSLQVLPIAGTSIVEVAAEGLTPEPLAPAINTLFTLYQHQLDERHRARTGDAGVKAKEEAVALQARVAQKRRAIDEFRARHNIVSLDREESPVLSQVKGLGASLNVANEKIAATEGRLKSLRAALTAGRGAVRARDDPTVASLEQRLSQGQEELRALQRQFTDDYLALDPNVRALRSRLTNLEEQIGQARSASRQAALSEAEEELASARAAAERINQQMNSSRQSVQAFTARLAEYQSMQEELDRLDKQRQAAVARATALETSSRRIAPSVQVLEPASLPLRPIRPDYTRDAAIAGAGSLLLALLMVALAEVFNRPERAAPSDWQMMEYGWGPPGLPVRPMPPPLAFENTSARQLPNRPQAQQDAPLLEAAASVPMPRELAPHETTALLDAADAATRPLLMALLSGLTADEAAALNRTDLDFEARWIHLPDRRVPLAGPLAEALLSADGATDGAGSDSPEAPVFKTAGDRLRQSAAHIDAAVAFAAHDAGLAHPSEVNAAMLRHSYIAHLVRQGARFSDLSRWVGRLPADALGIYARLAPDGPKRAADTIDPVLPALR